MKNEKAKNQESKNLNDNDLDQVSGGLGQTEGKLCVEFPEHYEKKEYNKDQHIGLREFFGKNISR